MKKRTNQLNKKGFTLIEVVLVLAIGGLIFLLAFIAFRQASVNRRDSARRTEANRFIAEVSNYVGDAGGKIPGQASPAISVTAFANTYLGNPWNDPQGRPYNLISNQSTITNGTATPSDYIFLSSRKCDGNSFTTGLAGDYAILMKLEKGAVCRDSGSN